jgi:hypothetical protein
MREAPARPIGVAVVAALLAVNGVAVLVTALGVLGPADDFVGTAIGVLFGFALLYLAYGMWTLQGWAWLATLLLQGVNGFFALLAVVSSPGAVGAWRSLAVAAAVIFYLTRSPVRAAFGRERAP